MYCTYRCFNTQNYIYPFQNLSHGFILKIFLKFRKFRPRYSYKIYSYIKNECISDSNISGNDDCVESKPLLLLSLCLLFEEISNSCIQIKVLNHKSRISVLSIFRHCFMFKPFSQYAMLLITLNAMHVASSAITFFLRITAHWIFFLDKFPLQEFFCGGGGIVTPPPVISNGPSLSNS